MAAVSIQSARDIQVRLRRHIIVGVCAAVRGNMQIVDLEHRL